MARDVERDFRQPFGRFKKRIELEAAVRRQGVVRAGLRHGHDVVRLGIDAEFRRIKILEHKGVAQLGDIDDGANVIGDLRAILQREAIAACRRAFAREAGVDSGSDSDPGGSS